jgi:putative ABC transport system substrate-binding protein
MKRREFITLIGGAAATLPLAARAQQSSQQIRICQLFLGGQEHLARALETRLRELGYVNGKNIRLRNVFVTPQPKAIEDQITEVLPETDVLVVWSTVASVAAKKIAQSIPIVFLSVGVPVDIGLVASLNRPGGNVTGVNLIFGALGAKRLELLHEFIPDARTVAVLVNLNYPSAASEVQDIQTSARTLALQVDVLNAPAASDFEKAFATIAERKIGSLLVADDPFLQSRRDQLIALAARHAIPAIYDSRDFVEDGGLMSYGPNINDAYRLVGVYIGRTLRGEKPADLPVIQPTKFELVINLKTAKALGREVPPKLLALADEVIE